MNDEEKYPRKFLAYLTQRWVFTALVCLGFIAILIPPALAYVRNCGPITINGSTALFPLVDQARKEYMKQKWCVFETIMVQDSGSKDGLSQVEEGKVDIGNSDIFADPSSQKDLQDHQVAVVVFALVIHKDKDLSKITNLNTQQIQSIYGGAYSNWNQVNPAISSPLNIIIVSRPATSGTRATFGQYVLKGLETVSGSQVADKNEDVAQFVCQTSGAIGYVSLYYYYQYEGCLQKISIDGSAPTPQNVKSNTYLFWNIEHMYTKGVPRDTVQQFIDFMSTDSVRNYINQFGRYGYLDINGIPSNVLATHLSL